MSASHVISRVTGFDNPTVEICLYSEQLLFDTVGRASEDNTVMLLEQVFEFAEVNATIRHGFPPQSYPDDSGGICSEPFLSWNDAVLAGDVPFVGQDANMLLLNGLSGGCSNAPNNDVNSTVAHARPMQNFTEYAFTREESGLNWNAPYSILHELAHNLGFPHRNHGAWAFDLNGFWWRTPSIGGNNTDNACGEFIENRDSDSAMHYLFYHWCMISEMNLPGRPSPSPPSQYPPQRNGELPPHADMFTRPIDIDDVAVLNCDVDAQTIAPGETATLFAILENEGPTPAQVDVVWTQNGNFLAATVVTVPADGSADPEITVDYEDFTTEGTATIEVDVELL